MAGILYFGNDCGSIGYNSMFMGVFGEYIRPYIKMINESVMNKIYESYDLYDESLDFSKLSQVEYLQCYEQIQKAIEDDLVNITNFYNNYPKKNIYDAWYSEIKPKMQSCLRDYGRCE